MKRIFTSLAAILFAACAFAQAPQKMTYQSVVRTASGSLVKSSPVGIKISILQGSSTGALVYQEIFSPAPQTNVNGLVSIEVGAGIPLAGSFSAINWASGPYFIKTEVDPTGGTVYTISGTSQLLSVPYAFYSERTAGTGATGSNAITLIYSSKGF